MTASTAIYSQFSAKNARQRGITPDAASQVTLAFGAVWAFPQGSPMSTASPRIDVVGLEVAGRRRVMTTPPPRTPLEELGVVSGKSAVWPPHGKLK